MPDKRQIPSAPHTTSKKKDSKSALTLVGQQYRGPLPPPNILEHYNAIYPDSAKIIIDNFIAQSEHRRSLEKTLINAGSRDSLLGIISAFIIGMTTVIGSVICILQNKEHVGLSLGIVGLSSLVGTFIYGTRQRRQERESKNQKLMTKPSNHKTP